MQADTYKMLDAKADGYKVYGVYVTGSEGCPDLLDFEVIKPDGELLQWRDYPEATEGYCLQDSFGRVLFRALSKSTACKLLGIDETENPAKRERLHNADRN